MLPASVHCTVENIFQGTIGLHLTSLRSEIQLESDTGRHWRVKR